MKKIVFFLALFSFSMGCFAQQGYEREINELKSRYNSLVILVQKLEKENESKKAELEKKKDEWERECELCIEYADYLSDEDLDSLIAQTDSVIDGKDLIASLIYVKNNRNAKPVIGVKPTINIKQPTSEETHTSTIIVEVKDENNSEKDEFSEDAKFRDKIISTPNDTVRVNRLHHKKLAGGVQNNKNIIPNEKNK